MTLPVNLTDAFPMTEADGITGRNNGRDIRRGFIAALLSPDVKVDPLAVRNGVFPHDFDSLGVTSLRVDQTATASTSLLVHPGAFVSERSGQGPYVGWYEGSGNLTITPDGADPSNPRIDVFYVVALDQASIGTDAQTNAVVNILKGTPSATPVVPSGLPDGAVALAQVLRPAGVSTIALAQITDVRRSTGLMGAARLLMPGDFVTDAGKVWGDLRLRPATGALPALLDYWDPVQAKWRGTQTVSLSQGFPGTPNGAGQLSGTTSGTSRLTVITATVPDPGWPYRVKTSGVVRLSGGTANVYVSVNNALFSSPIQSIQGGDPPGPFILTHGDSGIITGSSTVRLNIDPISGVTVAWSTDQRNKLLIDVVPA